MRRGYAAVIGVASVIAAACALGLPLRAVPYAMLCYVIAMLITAIVGVRGGG